MAINTKTYITKSNTIVKDSEVNLSLNPIMELNYGGLVTRGMIYFDHEKIKKLIEDKTYPDVSKLKHVLHMTNTASVNERKINCGLFDNTYTGDRLRAISFDVILFLIPRNWDEGRGFDFAKDLYNQKERGVSTGGSSWYRYRSFMKWDNDGIYTTEQLSREVNAFTSLDGNQSDVVIAYQHFDKGNEDLVVDITDTVNKFIEGTICNYGIGIAFSPKYEELSLDVGQYVGFFTNNTNSFFEPYVETIYEDTIEDDRLSFYLDKPNKLYFFSQVGGNFVNLDNLPIVTVGEQTYNAKQATKGVYYIDIELSSSEHEADTMIYDVWSNLSYNGKAIPDVELSFVTKESNEYFGFGLPSTVKQNKKFDVSIYGIKHNEIIVQGDVRKINVDCVIPYTSNQQVYGKDIYYRVFVKDAYREVDVINYAKLERAYNENYFVIKTDELFPNRYFIDLKLKNGVEEIYKKEIISFVISDNIENHFE